MDKKAFLLCIDEIIEAEPGTVTGEETLNALGWDSLAALGFIAAMDERLNVEIVPKELSQCETVDDLFAMINRRLNAQ